MSAGMPSDHPLRVAVIPHARAPRWSRAVINALRETQGLDLDIQSSIHPHSVPRHARDALSQSNGAILKPQLCDAVVDLAGAATDVEPRFGVWRYGFGDGALFAEGAPGTYARLYRAIPDPARAV